MKTKIKTFQNSRDVFAEYIPGYEKQLKSRDEQLRDPEFDASETVARLMTNFKNSVAPPEDA